VRAAASDAVTAGYRVISLDRFGDSDLRAIADHWEPLNDQNDWSSLPCDPASPIVPTGGFVWPQDELGTRRKSASERTMHAAAACPAASKHSAVLENRVQADSHRGEESSVIAENRGRREHRDGRGRTGWVSRVLYPAADRVRELQDPNQLAAIAAESGIGFPITRELNAANLAAIQDPENWLIKPIGRTGGAGIRSLTSHMLATTKNECPSELSFATTEPASSVIEPFSATSSSLSSSSVSSSSTNTWAAEAKPNVLQRRVVGRSMGVNYFARQRAGRLEVRLLGVFAGLTYRRVPSHRWLYAGSCGPCGEHWADRPARMRLSELGHGIAARFDLVGLFNVDLIRSPDGSLTLLEINPRYSASMELLTGYHSQPPTSLIDWHIAAYAEQAGTLRTDAADRRTGWRDRDRPLVPVGLRACKRIVYARHDHPPRDPPGWLALVEPERFRPLSVSLHDLPSAATPAGFPLLTVIVRGHAPLAEQLQVAAAIDRHLNRPSN